MYREMLTSLRLPSCPLRPLQVSAFHTAYQPVEAIDARLAEIADRRPCIATLRTLPGGAHILKLARSGTLKPQIWVQGGMHSCEWIGPAAVMYLADALPDSALLDDVDVHLLPVFNVDGYRRSWEHGNRFWRNCVPSGINPNLNFPTAFGRFPLTTNALMRPHLPGGLLYTGPSPLCEESVRVVANELRGLASSLRIFVDLHSYGQLWGFPYAHTRFRCQHHQELKAAAEIAVTAARDVHGVQYQPVQLSHLETVGGTIVDWVYEELGVTHSYCVELRPELPSGFPFLWALLSKGIFAIQEGFQLPEAQIRDVGEEVAAGIQALALHVLGAGPKRRPPC